MKNFIYENSTKVYFGQGCVREFLTSLVKDYDTVMMAYGQGSVKRNGIYDEILNILMKAGKNVVGFSGIMPNLTYSKVMEGARLARSSGVQLILGIGGGSVMDCCKAVSLAACCEEEPWENYWERKGVIDFSPIPVGVIVTLAGTGSECSGRTEQHSTDNASDSGSGSGNVLVVYYSATGNTEEVANYIADATGGDLFEVEPAEPYTDDDLNWTDDNSRVSREYADESLIEEKYDEIYEICEKGSKLLL